MPVEAEHPQPDDPGLNAIENEQYNPAEDVIGWPQRLQSAEHDLETFQTLQAAEMAKPESERDQRTLSVCEKRIKLAEKMRDEAQVYVDQLNAKEAA